MCEEIDCCPVGRSCRGVSKKTMTVGLGRVVYFCFYIYFSFAEWSGEWSEREKEREEKWREEREKGKAKKKKVMSNRQTDRTEQSEERQTAGMN